MKNSVITLSDKLTPYIYTLKDGNTIEDKANIAIVMGLFASKIISLEKAAELANENIWDFIDLLKMYNIPWGEYTKESAEMDSTTIDRLSKGVYENK